MVEFTAFDLIVEALVSYNLEVLLITIKHLVIDIVLL